jgi:hypothetical protein
MRHCAISGLACAEPSISLLYYSRYGSHRNCCESNYCMHQEEPSRLCCRKSSVVGSMVNSGAVNSGQAGRTGFLRVQDGAIAMPSFVASTSDFRLKRTTESTTQGSSSVKMGHLI